MSNYNNIGYLKQVIDSNPLGMVLVDATANDMPIIYTNDAFENLTGYSRDEVIGRNSRFLHGIDRNQPNLDILRNAIENGRSCTVTLRNYRKDGSLFWNELHLSPIFDANGQLIQYAGIQNDVTDHFYNSEYLQAILNSSLNGIMAFDAVRNSIGKIVDFRWTQINHQAEKIIGRPREALIGKHLLREMPGHEELGLFDLYVDVVETEKSLEHEHFYSADNIKTWFRTTAVKLADGFVLTFADISKRKNAEQQLLEQHDELNRFFSVTLDLLCIVDMSGTLIRTNKAWETLLGYTDEDLIGQSLLELIHPDDVYPTLDALQQLDRQEKVIGFINRYRTKEGTYRVIEWRSNPYGEFIYAAGRDVTERQEMEASLREREQRHRLTLKGTRAGTWEWNIQTGETIFNERWAEIIGYTLDELEPISIETWVKLTHPDDLERSNELLQAHFAGKSIYYECEARMKHKDGHWVWVLDRGTVMEWDADNKPLRMFGTHIDISQRKAIEEELYRTEQEFRTLTEKSPNVIVRIRRDGTYLYANPAFARLVGIPLEDIINKHNLDLGIPETVEAELSIWRNQVYETGDQAEMELDYTAGEFSRSYHLRFIPERNIDGSVSTIIMIGHDVTHRKQAQQREFELKLELERRELLTSFIQNAAHEFRTPLSIISSSTYLMSRLEDAERRVQKAQQIDTNIGRIANLVDMLMLTAKLENHTSAHMESIDISSLIEEIWQETTQKYSDTHHFSQERIVDLPTIQGEPDHLAEALKQIIENACRFTSEGGNVKLSTQINDGCLWIEVSDSGPGIAQDELPHIFETFWRQDKTHTTPGLGLGLPIAQRIIEQHGGKIMVETAENSGTTFRVILPI